MSVAVNGTGSLFLSTPSARRATYTLSQIRRSNYISIHALREEGDQCKTNLVCAGHHISIHALREEGDTLRKLAEKTLGAFLSTPSARRATTALTNMLGSEAISIHALREEGDMAGWSYGLGLRYISIHALREEGDPPPPTRLNSPLTFLSTPSARRATLSQNCQFLFYSRFLSTPSARRATHRRPHGHGFCNDFYPRPPRGGRRSYGSATDKF